MITLQWGPPSGEENLTFIEPWKRLRAMGQGILSSLEPRHDLEEKKLGLKETVVLVP